VTEVVPSNAELLGVLAANGIYGNGLHLTDPNLSYDRVEAIGGLLAQEHSDVRLAMGDWLLFVEAKFPEKFSQASEMLNINEEARAEYMRTCRGVPRSMRRKNPRISYSHYRALAAMKTVDHETGEVQPDFAAQREILDKLEAAPRKIGHAELRDMLRPDDQPKPDPTVCRCCHRPL
jgi:hypothetical protein